MHRSLECLLAREMLRFSKSEADLGRHTLRRFVISLRVRHSSSGIVARVYNFSVARFPPLTVLTKTTIKIN